MKFWIAVLVVLVTTLGAVTSWAGGRHCCHCGSESHCQKVCRLVCEMKEVTKVAYDCKCEDICVPGPSTRTPVCSCGDCNECSKKKYLWTPHCAQVKTRKLPVKREEKVLKPTYKWVVEYVCDQCATAQAADATRQPTNSRLDRPATRHADPPKIPIRQTAEKLPIYGVSRPKSGGGGIRRNLSNRL